MSSDTWTPDEGANTGRVLVNGADEISPAIAAPTRGRREFTAGKRIIFRESETGAPEPGAIAYALEPDAQYPNGGVYAIDLDDGTVTDAFWTELTLVSEG